MTKAMSEMGSFDQARDVCHNKGLFITGVNRTQVWILGRKRIIRNLWMSSRYSREQSRLSRIGKTNQPYVGNDLEFESNPTLLTNPAVLCLSRCPIGCR